MPEQTFNSLKMKLLESGIANPGKVAKWGAAPMPSAGITAAMFLSRQLAIALT